METALAILMGLVILILEMTRKRRLFYLDFLRGISLSMFIAFVLVPIIIHWFGIAEDPYRFYWQSWIKFRDPWLSVPAQLVALLGYISIWFGFGIGISTIAVKNTANTARMALKRIGYRLWFLLAIALFVGSVISLQLYILRRGADIVTLLKFSGRIRVGDLPWEVSESSFTFLTYAMFIISATYVLIGLRQEIKCSNFVKGLVNFLMLTGVVLSLIVLYMKAGRLHIFNFLLTLLLVILSRLKSRLLKIVMVMVIPFFFFITLLQGKFLLGIAYTPYLLTDVLDFLKLFASELSFPYLSLVNTIDSLDRPRLFVDMPLAFLYVFGNPVYRILTGMTLDLPPSVAKENTLMILGTTSLGEIPVDVVTLGYFNAGVIGVLITGLLFGMLLAWLEVVFSERTGFMSIFRHACMVFFSTVGTLYADPVNVLRDGLYIIGPLFVAITAGLMLRRKQGV